MPRWNVSQEVRYETAIRSFLDRVRGAGRWRGWIGRRAYENSFSRMARRRSARGGKTGSRSIKSDGTGRLLSRSGGFAGLFAYSKKDFGGQGLSRGPQQRRFELRAGGSSRN